MIKRFINLQNIILPTLICLSLTGVYVGNAIGIFFLVITSVYAFLVLPSPNKFRFILKISKPYFLNLISCVTLLFFLSLLISGLIGINIENSLKTFGGLIFLSGLSFLIFIALTKSDKNVLIGLPRYFFWACCTLALLLLIEVTLSKTIDIDFHDGGINNSIRRFGTILAILLPFALTHAFSKEDGRYWAGIFIISFIIFMSGGRAAIICGIFSFIIFAYFAPWARLKEWKKTFSLYWMSLIASLSMGISGYYLFAGAEKFGYRVSGYDAATGSGRTEIWDFAFTKIFENPYFGIGPRNFRNLDFSNINLTSYFHPHNMVLELALETGIIGLGLAIIIGVLVLRKTWKVLYSNNLYAVNNLHSSAQAILLSLFAYILAAQFMTSIFHGWWFSYLLLLLSLLAACLVKLINLQRDVKSKYGSDLTKTYPVSVSIIMPCHNGEPYLDEAICSVLSQTYSSWELLIIDDGSRDNSYNIMSEYVAKDNRIKIFQNSIAHGEGAARNKLIQFACGRYIAFLDCDDRWLPDKLSIQIPIMEENCYPLTYGSYHIINENGKRLSTIISDRPSISLHHMFYTNDISCPTAVYDSAYFGLAQMGNFKRNTDMLFWISLLKNAYAAKRIDSILSEYRVHKNGISYNKWLMAKAHWQTFRNDLKIPLPMALYYFGRYVIRGLKKTLKYRNSK
jgi:teichuronic acid biosynthesis glycosyltransferase TuaG